MDQATLQRVPVQFQPVYQRHWKTIKTSVKQGRIKDVYHFPLFTLTDTEISEKAHAVIGNYNDNIKINVAFGFILENRTTGELKFFHPSNNTRLFPTPRLLASPNDYRQFVDDIEHEDAFEYARVQRPTTKWVVKRMICVRFDVYKL
jgi:hypothetical protein